MEPTLAKVLGDYRNETLFDKQNFFEHFVHGKPPVALTDVRDITFSNLKVKGFLSNDASLDEYRDALERFWSSAGQRGSLRLTVGFEERESKQSADAYDTITVHLEKGSPFIGYADNASKLSVDPAHARSFLAKAISSLSLPMVLVDADGYHTLEPRDGNEVRPMGGLLGRNPTGFICEVPELNSAAELAGLLHEFCALFVEDRVFEVYWTASHSGLKDGASPGHALVTSIYNATVAKLDEGRHEVNIHYSLQGLQGLDAVSTLCGETDEVATPFWNVFPDEKRVCINLRTTATGHRIKLVSKSQEALDVVREAMQLTEVCDP